MIFSYKISILGLFISLASNIAGLYSGGSEVVDLTPDNFHKLVISSDEVWIVEFYAPWCGHCKSLVPEYTKAAKALKGVVKVGGVNADEHRGLGGQYQVQGFPTIKIFGADKYKPQDCGGRNAQGIVDAALKAAKDKVNIALSGKKTSEGGGSSDSSDVVELTDSNFEKLVLQSDELWLVEFFAPWCGHCKNLEPHWKKAAAELKGKVKLGALDATVNTAKASHYGVQGYPTIKFFNKGEMEEYNGGRTSSDIVQWAMDKLSLGVSPPEIHQLVDNKILDKACQEHPICVIAVLPHILDCQSDCRNNHLKVLADLGDKFKQKMWGWVWTEAMTYTALENMLDMGGFGYPALAVLNVKKMQYALFKGSFGKEGLKEFFRDISYGRGSTSPVRGAKLPKISKIQPWDGKDGVLETEEDIDLEDVVLDDLGKEEL